MEDIKIGYIYKIVDNTNDNVYYGSTTTSLKKRLGDHRTDYKRYLEGKNNYITSFEIIKNNNYNIICIEEVSFNDICLLYERERWHIKNNDCVNINIPTRKSKEQKEIYKLSREKRLCNICDIEVTNWCWDKHIKSFLHQSRIEICKNNYI
jgi:hypothetical protein